MKKILLIIFGATFILNFFLIPGAFAETKTLQESTFNVKDALQLDLKKQEANYFNDKDNSPIVSLILAVINFAAQVMGTIGVILIIAAGFIFMFSQGNQQRIDKGKEVVKYAIIGLIIAFLSYVIVTSIQTIFNIA